MKKTIIAAGAASALLFGAVAIAQTPSSTDPADPATTADTGTAADTSADEAQTSGATTASEYGDDASGTALDAAGERG